jgi:hypothetical protein
VLRVLFPPLQVTLCMKVIVSLALVPRWTLMSKGQWAWPCSILLYYAFVGGVS